MPRYYKPESFLRYLKYNTVRQFLEFMGIDKKLPPKFKHQSRADYLKNLFGSFDEKTCKKIDVISTRIKEINDVCKAHGVMPIYKFSDNQWGMNR